MLRHRAIKRQRGAAAVEFGLVMPLLTLLVMGALDWGRYLYVAHLVTNAAREGARAGTLEIPGEFAAAEQGATRAVEEYLKRGNLDPVSPAVDWPLGADAVQVTVTVPFESVTGFGLVPLPEVVTASAVMRWQ
jgi:Flp pilus assembly pilin Flp